MGARRQAQLQKQRLTKRGPHSGAGKTPTKDARKGAKPSKGVRKKMKLDQSPLYQPSKLLSGADLRHTVDSLADLEIKPQTDAYTKQANDSIATGQEQVRRSSAYYNQLAGDQQKNYDLGQALSAKTAASLKGIADQSTWNSAAAGAVAQDRLNQASPLDGGAKTQLAAEMAARMQNQQNNAQTYQSTGALQSQNQGNLALNNMSSRRLKQDETMGTLRGRAESSANDAYSKRASVESTRGDLKTKLLNQMRQSEFEKAATIQGLGLKQADLAQNAADDAADNAADKHKQKHKENDDARQARLDRAKLKEDQAKAARGDKLAAARLRQDESHFQQSQATSRRGQDLSHSGKGKGSSKPSAGQLKGRQLVATIGERYKTVRQQPRFKGHADKAVADYYRGKGVNDLLIRAGQQYAKYGHPLPATLRALKKAGYW